MKNKIKALLFDVDGVLINSRIPGERTGVYGINQKLLDLIKSLKKSVKESINKFWVQRTIDGMELLTTKPNVKIKLRILNQLVIFIKEGVPKTGEEE